MKASSAPGEEHLSGRIFRRGMAWALGIGVFVTALVYLVAEPLFHGLFVHINPNEEISALMTPREFASETSLITQILSLSLLGFPSLPGLLSLPSLLSLPLLCSSMPSPD